MGWDGRTGSQAATFLEKKVVFGPFSRRQQTETKWSAVVFPLLNGAKDSYVVLMSLSNVKLPRT